MSREARGQSWCADAELRSEALAQGGELVADLIYQLLRP
jgi:hypothetical protein